MSFSNTLEFNTHRFSQRNRILALSILFISICVIYWDVTELGFTNWDDNLYLTENSQIQNFEIEKAFSDYTVGLYTPMVSLSYMLDYYFFELNPAYYHIENTIWHLINCLLVYLLVLKLTKHELAAFVTSLLFAIHPLHVEPVAWISSRKDLLFTFFYLIAWICYLEYLEKGKVQFLIFTVLIFGLSCISKPAAVSFPLVALFLNYINTRSKKIKDYLHLIPFFLLALITGINTLYGAYILDLRKTPDLGYSFFEYIYFSTYGLTFYIVKLLFPSNLSSYYVYPNPGEDFPLAYLISPLFFIAFISSLIYFWRKQRHLFIPVILSILIVSPMLRFAPQGFPMVADRYFYLASLGVLMIPGLIISKSDKSNLRFLVLAICLILSTVFIFVSKRQLKIWKNSNTLWTHTISIYPDFYYAYQERGKYYLELGNKERALADFRKSLALEENNPGLITNVANIMSEIGSADDALELQDIVVVQSKSASAYYNRANTYKAKNEFLKAIEDYSKALEIDSSLAQAYNNRGICYVMIKDKKKAFLDFKKACELDSENQMFRDNLERIEKLLE